MKVEIGFDLKDEERPSPLAKWLVGGLFGAMIVPAVLVLMWTPPGTEDLLEVRESEAARVENLSEQAADEGKADVVERVRARGRSWSADDDVSLTPLEPQSRPGTERAFYAQYTQIAARGPEAFRAAATAALSKSRSRAESVAVLRVSYDLDVVPDFEFFLGALMRTDVRPEVRDFALRFIGDKSRKDREARKILVRYLDSNPKSNRCRAEVFFAVLRWGDDDEIRGLVPLMFAERDSGVLSKAARALKESEEPGAEATLESLRYQHPVAAVRRAVAVVCGK